MAKGSGFRVQGQALEFKVWVGLRVEGLGFRV
jgi:hypothetical protein